MITLLNGGIKMHKSNKFSNPSQDGIWLAESLNIKPNQSCLDVGCGTGVVSLCAKFLYPSSQITGIDIQSQAISLAKQNSILNNFNINWLVDDITNNSLEQKFDVVFSNPPFHRSDKGFSSKNNEKAFSTTKEGVINWINNMLELTATNGTVHLIHHKQNEDIIYQAFSDYNLKIIPIITSKSKPAKRILITIKPY